MKNFRPSKEMINSAEMAFSAMAICQMMEEKVLPIQKSVLDSNQFVVAKCWSGLTLVSGEVITNPKDTHLMSDSDFNSYVLQCRAEEEKIGIAPENKELCPMLVAQQKVREAKRAMLLCVGKVAGISDEVLDYANLEKREQLVQICFKLMAPFVRSGKEIAEELCQQ